MNHIDLNVQMVFNLFAPKGKFVNSMYIRVIIRMVISPKNSGIGWARSFLNVNCYSAKYNLLNQSYDITSVNNNVGSYFTDKKLKILCSVYVDVGNASCITKFMANYFLQDLLQVLLSERLLNSILLFFQTHRILDYALYKSNYMQRKNVHTKASVDVSTYLKYDKTLTTTAPKLHFTKSQSITFFI